MVKVVKSFLSFVKGQDLYGHPIGVTYNGEETYKTWPGAICTLAVYALVMFNLVLLGKSFQDNSNQVEKVNIKKFDRFGSKAYNLAENGIQFYLFPHTRIDDNEEFADENGELISPVTFEALRPDIGSYVLYQFFPCDPNDSKCVKSGLGYEQRDIKFEACSPVKTKELTEYYLSRNKVDGGFAHTAQCIADENLIVQGDPFSDTSNASLVIDFVPCSKGDEDIACAPDEEVEEWLELSGIDLVIDEKQVDMEN